MSESAKRSDFKNKMSPHLEDLLEFSLWLTRNGRGATRLMREAMAEAYRLWDESLPKEDCNMRLHRIMIRRFFASFEQHKRPQGLISADNVDDSLVENNRLFSAMTANARQRPWPTGEYDEDADYLEAIAGLPAVCRSAMILSYLEGFSNKEIADLAGGQLHTVEAMLSRGRRFIQKELFAHLMDNGSFVMVADRAAAAG